MKCVDCSGCSECDPDEWMKHETCTFCGEVGHWRPDCPEIAKMMKKLRRIKK